MRKKILLALGSAVFALMIGEVAARIVLPLLPDPPNTPFIGDDACMYLLRPSEPGQHPEDHPDHINRLGFRDRNHPPTKPNGRLRVLGLGDSFVYGAVPPGENFLRVAERALNENSGLPVDILLMGVPGWSTENELGYLMDQGLDLEPDLVVVNFFVGNDVTGIPVRGRVIRGHVYPRTSPLPVRNLLRKSHLFVMFESLALRRMVARIRGDQAGAPAPLEAPVNDLYLKIVDQTLPVFARDPDDRTASLWDEAEEYLQAIDSACRLAGVPWLLVLIPDEVQVDSKVRSQVLEGLGLTPDQFDFDAPNNRLNSWAATNQVPVLDLLPVMRHEHMPGFRLYIPNDTHWSQRGNLAAGMMVGWSIQDQLVPEPEEE